jgi:CheY-like chemotaxis protein
MTVVREAKIILLADDDADDTDLFSEALTSAGQDIVCYTTGNGQEAISKLDELEEMPSLIFLDINMPVMNGWQCIKILKAHDVYKNIPVIIYSTSSHKREADIALELGALAFLSKPTDYDQLEKILSTVSANLGDGLVAAIKKVKDIESAFYFERQ